MFFFLPIWVILHHLYCSISLLETKNYSSEKMLQIHNYSVGPLFIYTEKNLHVFLTVYTATSPLSNQGKNAPKVQQFISQIQESFRCYISSYIMLFKFTVTICFSNIFPILRMRTIWHREPCSFGMLCVCILWDSNLRSDPRP